MGQSTRVVQTNQEVSMIRDLILSTDSTIEIRDVPGNIAWQLAKEGKGVISAYSSGKIVIQSTDSEWTDEISSIIIPENQDEKSDFIPHIGVDETGKGDFFGPLVVAAVFVENATQRDELIKLGVRDSKKLSDPRAISLRNKILDLCAYTHEVVISPEEYNDRYVTLRNANKLLAQGHAKAIEETYKSIPKGDCALVVVDQFSKSKSRVLDELLENGKKLEIVQMHGGESDIAVAAASIVARGRFLEEMRKMGEKYKVTFPKGASDVISFGKKFLKDYGIDELKNVAKMSFKTAIQVTSSFDL